MPDFAAAAKELGITETQLRSALGTSNPPDIAKAAKTLGIAEASLMGMLGIMPKP
jgi:hypothetical protein